MASETSPGFIDAARIEIDHALEQWLPQPPACPPLLAEAMRYSVMAGGKRLRPVLALAAAETISPTRIARQAALPVACALEFIHTYSLIHDDLPAMDDDSLRRGRPTLHVLYGDGLAILAGDALQAEAFALIAREPNSNTHELAERKLRVSGIVAQAAGAIGMVGGQAIDLQAAGQIRNRQAQLDGEALRAMHLKKTGALIRAAAVSGAVMAGADDRAIDAIEQWGTEIGLAFQIVDDILDVEGSSTEMGKTVGKDAAHDKPTYPSLFGLDRAREMADRCAHHAQQMLTDAGLAHGRLTEIADWVLRRRN
ncbi:MAG: polyprenyl synthetase family protein [Acidobacteriaceae bacterium]|jgi:geranylgeranyl diphosphate synthase type II|nr:polyprenyl synthetase family protein [Acidobacteriaceae bacterium]